MTALRRLERLDGNTGVVLAISVLLAALAIQQYLAAVYVGAVVLGVGSIVGSLFATVTPERT